MLRRIDMSFMVMSNRSFVDCKDFTHWEGRYNFQKPSSKHFSVIRGEMMKNKNSIGFRRRLEIKKCKKTLLNR